MPASDLPPDALTVAGLTVGTSEASVLAVVDGPVRRPVLSEADAAYDSRLEWADGNAYLNDGRLEFFQTTRHGHCTGLGLCIGDSEASAASRIGCAAPFDPQELVYACFDTASGCSVEAVIQDKVVSALRLECLP